jgi:hypothetical protein
VQIAVPATITGTSSAAFVSKLILTQPFTSSSVNTASFVGGALVTGAFTASSSSTASFVGGSLNSTSFNIPASSTFSAAGNSQIIRAATIVASSSTSFVGGALFTGQFTVATSSTLTAVSKVIITQPFIAASVSAVSFVGGSLATGAFTATSSSTLNFTGLVSRISAFNIAASSSTAIISAQLAHSAGILPRPQANVSTAIYIPQPITASLLGSLSKPAPHDTATYLPAPITAAFSFRLILPTAHAIAGFLPVPITSLIKTTVPRPLFYGQSLLVSALNVLVWGAQIEPGAGITSFIPTNGTSATRASDNLLISTSDSPYVVTLDALVLCSLAQAILDYTPQTSNEAVSILTQFINLFDSTIAPASNLNWISTVSALTKLRTTVLQYLQQQIAVEPIIQIQSFGDQVPDVVAAYTIYGDATRASQLVASNDPVNPLYMPTRIAYNA